LPGTLTDFFHRSKNGAMAKHGLQIRMIAAPPLCPINKYAPAYKAPKMAPNHPKRVTKRACRAWSGSAENSSGMDRSIKPTTFEAEFAQRV